MQARETPAALLDDAAAPAAVRSGRFELKYTLPDHRKHAAAAWLDAICAGDPMHPVGHVRTLYLDTVDHRFLGQKVNSDYCKAKVRIRWYAVSAASAADGSAWVEIKSKQGARGAKHRTVIPGAAAELDGAPPASIDLEPLLAVLRGQGFQLPPLAPALLLEYTRRRWVDLRSSTRVALDTDIGHTWSRAGLGGSRTGRTLSTAIIELKGPRREAPLLLSGMVRFGARRESFSKYYECLR